MSAGEYELAEIPLSPVDLLNRMGVATGSMRAATAATAADYNGHEVKVTYLPHAVGGPRWWAEYWWGERVVLARGSLARCAAAARREWDRGARGTHVVAELCPDAPEALGEQRAILEGLGFVPVPVSNQRQRPHYWTGAHEAVRDAVQWSQVSSTFRRLIPAALAYRGTIEAWPVERDRLLNAGPGGETGGTK